MTTQKISNNELVANRWAKSLLELSFDDGLNKEIVLEHLIDIVDTLNASTELKELFVNPIVTVDEKQNVIEKVFGNVLPPTVKNFLKVLALRKRLGLLDDILEEYKKELNKCESIVRIKVTSAVNIDDWKKEDLKNRIIEKLSKNADIKWNVDNSIIGGLVFDIDGTIVDDSLNTKLSNLCKRIITK